jgi:hypothetical protein
LAFFSNSSFWLTNYFEAIEKYYLLLHDFVLSMQQLIKNESKQHHFYQTNTELKVSISISSSSASVGLKIIVYLNLELQSQTL